MDPPEGVERGGSTPNGLSEVQVSVLEPPENYGFAIVNRIGLTFRLRAAPFRLGTVPRLVSN